MSLPPFRDDKWLPAGHYDTTWEEIIVIFGGEQGSKRAQVLANLLDWRDRVRAKGIQGDQAAERRCGWTTVIANQEQLNVALHQLGSFKGMLEAMNLHLQKTEPTLIPLVSESYRHRIQELQEEICDYLLLHQSPTSIELAENAPPP